MQAEADQKIRNILAVVLKKGICSLEILCSENIIRFVYRHKRRLFFVPLSILIIVDKWLQFKIQKERRDKSEVLVCLRTLILK